MDTQNSAPASSSPPPRPIPPIHQHQKSRPFWREALSTLSILVSAFVIALLLIAYVFQSYAVDGSSMQQTLQNNDRLIVWKLPHSWSQLTHHQYIPKRGDIVVFNESDLSQYGQPNDRQLVKRVLGLPGDHVVVKDGKLTIYNSANPQGFQPDATLGYDKTGLVDSFTGGNIDITLSGSQLFVCGDNRSDSLDSRIFGPINTSQIVGKLIVRILPLGDAKVF